MPNNCTNEYHKHTIVFGLDRKETIANISRNLKHFDTFLRMCSALARAQITKDGNVSETIYQHTNRKTLSKAQRTPGIEYFDSFNISSSKQKLQQALKLSSNFNFVSFGKGQEIHKTTLTYPRKNFNKSMLQFSQIPVTT